jgi:heme exporter protein A
LKICAIGNGCGICQASHLGNNSYHRPHPPPKLDDLLASWQLRAAATQLVGTLIGGATATGWAVPAIRTAVAPVWLLDEPATALDQTGVGRLVQCLQDHVAAGGLCLFTSHQPLPLAATIWELS